MTEEIPNEVFLEQMILMGFDAASSSSALLATHNRSIDVAIEYLLNKPMNPQGSQMAPKYYNPLVPTPQRVNEREREKEKEREREREREKEKEREKEREREEREKKKVGVQKVKEVEEVEEEEEEEEEEDMMDYEEEDPSEYLNDGDDVFDELPSKELEVTTVLDGKKIQESAVQEIERVAQIMDTDLSTAGALLRFYHWNSEKLLEKYCENPKKTLQEAGVVVKTSSSLSAASVKVEEDCQICGETLSPSDSAQLECGHRFCTDCLRTYLTIQINEGNSLNIHCMNFKCKGTISDSVVRKLVTPTVYNKYREFVSKSFVEDNPNIKWCPRPGCGNAVKSDTKNILEAQCSCGFKFCFRCNGEAHAPSVCEMMKMWAQKCQDDSETSHWISTNTKDCPRCKSAIEKNGGCNHMTCRKCAHEFCWLCFGDWKNHTGCNKYTEDDKEKSQDRAALERYLHYYYRYQAHEQSKKFETTLRENAVKKMETIQNSDDSRWIDVQYIDSATEKLIECRRTLKYTYVFAFYLIDGPEKNLFEYLQSELERNTENLSGALEAPVGSQEPRQLKDLTNLAAKRLQHLLEGVSEMLETPSKAPFIPNVLELYVNSLPKNDSPPTKKANSATTTAAPAPAATASNNTSAVKLAPPPTGKKEKKSKKRWV